MGALTLFDEVPEHHVDAQGESHDVQHEEGDHEARRKDRSVLGKAVVEQSEHQKFRDEGEEPHDRMPDPAQGERRKWREDRPQDHRARSDEAAERRLRRAGRMRKAKSCVLRNALNRRVCDSTISPTAVISWYNLGIAADLG